MNIFLFNFYLSFFSDLGEKNPFKTFTDDVDEEEDVSEYSVITNEVNFLIRYFAIKIFNLFILQVVIGKDRT
jgi:hypothetical protein